MTTPARIDARLIRRRRDELAISLRGLATAAGVAPSVIVSIEQGHNHADVNLGVLHQLAEALAVDIADLVIGSTTEPAGADGPEPDGADVEAAGETVAADAAAVGAVLHATNVLTPTATLADVFDWPLDRITAALDHLDTQLPAAGLRLHRLYGRVRISGAATAADEATLADAVRRHIARDGLNLTEGRLLNRIMNSGVPKEPTNAQSVALGVLVNAALIEPGQAKARTSQVPMVLSDDVRFSLCLDDQPTRPPR